MTLLRMKKVLSCFENYFVELSKLVVPIFVRYEMNSGFHIQIKI